MYNIPANLCDAKGGLASSNGKGIPFIQISVAISFCSTLPIK